MVGKWVDKRVVLYLSTEFDNEMVNSTNRWNEPVTKPRPIVEYNKFISGVYRKDQLMAYYPCERKTLRCYKKLFVHYLQVAVINGLLFTNKYNLGQKMSLYDYRLVIIRRLLSSKQLVPRQLSPRSAQHFPINCQRGPQGKILRKKCRACKSRGIRKDTCYQCNACPEKPGLCLEPCFRDFHKYF